MSMWSSKALKQLQGHRWVRATSDWVIRRTNSKTVSAWLMIDLLISIGLGIYYFFFRYVPALGFAPLAMMHGFKFFVLVASVRAACTTWGILSVLFRSVRQVKLFYTVFIINLLVAVWLMIPVLSLHCRCDNYFQCEALQSFALDGLSLNKIPEPQYFGAERKVPYEVEPPSSIENLMRDPEQTSTTTSTTMQKAKETESTEKKDSQAKATESTEKKDSQAKATESTEKKDSQETNVAKAKNMAEVTQNSVAAQADPAELDALAANARNAPALIQRTADHGEEAHDHSELSLEDLISMGHSRVVSKRRQRNKRVEASLLQIESSEADPKKDDGAGADAKSEDAKGKPTDVKQDDMKDEQSKILGGLKDINVLDFFKPVGNMSKLVSGHASEDCTDDTKRMDTDWTEDESRMNLMEGDEEKDHDKKFLQTVTKCLANVNACQGISWTLQKDVDGQHYKSTACTIIGSTTIQNKEEQTGTRSLYFEKKVKEAKQLVSDPKVNAQLRKMACNADSPDEVVECHKNAYNTRCRCDAKSCRSYTQSDSDSERGWCYIDNKTFDLCMAESKEVFKDSNEKLFTKDICHEAENYAKSCKCKGIGMLPPEGKFIDDDLKDKAYGSFCAKWNGDENKFKWCYVGWDSSCVDRRRGEVNSLYKADGVNVPSQFWSELACDDQEPNRRLQKAEDLCENLEYTVNGVCLVHLFLSVPMIMVLYNYISNQCGDDIQTVAQFAVESSSDDEDPPAGQTRKSNDSGSFAKAAPAVPAFEGATESH